MATEAQGFDFVRVDRLLREHVDGDVATLIGWATHGDAEERYAACQHPDTPLDAVVALAEGDPDALIALACRADLTDELVARLAREGDGGVRTLMASRASTPSEVLAGLLVDDDRWVRRAAAANQNTPAAAVIAAAAGPWEVREDAALSPHCTAEALTELAEYTCSLATRTAIVEHANTPDEVAATLLVHAVRTRCDAAAIERTAQGHHPDVVAAVRALAGSHLDASDGEILELAHATVGH